jgi:heat shock protein HspQ
MANPLDPQNFQFEIGQIVHHKRYGYRGVVYDRDPICAADEDWYEKNKTQPDRNQPWYHVLVDGAAHTTYVAQSNLEADQTGAPILHPLLNALFKTYLDGRYYQEILN